MPMRLTSKISPTWKVVLLKAATASPTVTAIKSKSCPNISIDRHPTAVRLGILKWKVELKEVDKLSFRYKFAGVDQNVEITPELP